MIKEYFSLYITSCKQLKIMNNKFSYVAIPLFLAVYFIIAFTPILAKQKVEIFPFFSFKLYSKIPNEFVKYDLIYNIGESNESFLIYENSTLNKLERKNFNYRVNIMGSQYEETGNVFFENYTDLLAMAQSVSLVKISGNYKVSVLDDGNNVIFIRKFVLYDSKVSVGLTVNRSRDLAFYDTKQFDHFGHRPWSLDASWLSWRFLSPFSWKWTHS